MCLEMLLYCSKMDANRKASEDCALQLPCNPQFYVRRHSPQTSRCEFFCCLSFGSELDDIEADLGYSSPRLTSECNKSLFLTF